MNTGGPASEKTLLDWYAGQALAAMVEAESKESHKHLTNEGYGSEATYFTRGFADEYYWDGAAKASYACASAMLAEKARREATGKDSLQVPDHSPDAGKMAELEAANRELVEALEGCLENLERWCPVKHREARAILSKRKESK